jgi:TonB family protein
MHVLMTVVPEIQAEYVGGYKQLINYLKQNTIQLFSETDPKKVRQIVIRFTVNEEGKITDSKISPASGDSKTESLLLDVINNMPQWKPAENAQGVKVKQEFEFVVGDRIGDGC